MSPLKIRLVGAPDHPTAFSMINARWAAGLREQGHTVLTEGDEPFDVAVVYDWEQRFGPSDLPSGSPRVAVRTWDFGPYPARWVDVVREHYDELWVHSAWTRELAVRGGVPPDRVRVLPLGVDTDVLRVDGPVHPATTGAGTTFLFVGATVHRKGIDVLLDAYTEAFAADDDVALVVKDHTGNVFYGGQDHSERIRELADGPGPAITYIDELLDAGDLAALYRGADALVLPYRAEGFALPPLEAMACGTPVVVPEFGSSLDYSDARAAWFAPVRRISVPVGRSMTYNALGFAEEVTEIDLCEPDRAGLVAVLRAVAAEGQDVRAARREAAARAATGWSWSASVARVADALADVTGQAAEAGDP